MINMADRANIYMRLRPLKDSLPHDDSLLFCSQTKETPRADLGFFRPEMLTRQQRDPDLVIPTKPGLVRQLLFVGTPQFYRRGTWCRSESPASHAGRSLQSAATFLVYRFNGFLANSRERFGEFTLPDG
jgi:hypothetical protein